jgi:hypothetical protein
MCRNCVHADIPDINDAGNVFVGSGIPVLFCRERKDVYGDEQHAMGGSKAFVNPDSVCARFKTYEEARSEPRVQELQTR